MKTAISRHTAQQNRKLNLWLVATVVMICTAAIAAYAGGLAPQY